MSKNNIQSRFPLIFWLSFIVVAILGIIMIFVFQVHDHEPVEEIAIVEANPNKVVLYSSLQEPQLEVLKRAFEAKYPGITLEYFSAGTGKVLTKISADRQMGSMLADVVWVGNPASYRPLLRDDLLEPYAHDNVADIPDVFQMHDDRFVTARLSVMGFVYHAGLLASEAVPTTWEEVLKTQGVVFADPASSGATLYALQLLVGDPDYGWEYMQRLYDSGAEICSGSGATAYQVGEGEYQVGIVGDHVAAMIRNTGKPLGFVVPEDKPIIVPCPIALLKDSPHPEAGKLLIDYILSDEGQELLAMIDVIPARGDFSKNIAAKVEPVDWVNVTGRREFLSRFNEMFLK